MKMRKNIVSVLAMLLVLLLTVGSFGAAFAETAATTKPLSELTQEDIDYLRSLLVTEDGPLMGEELLAHINSFTGEELYWTLAAVSDEQYASLQEILTEEELTALFAPLHEVVYVAPRDYTNVAPLVDFGTASYALRAADTGDGNQSETEGLFLKKTAAFDPATYTGKITMEAYVEGSVSTTTTVKPLDVVLVLDVSGSMADTFMTLEEVYSLDQSKTYYNEDGVQIRWRDRMGTSNDGWYTVSGYNNWGSRVYPMTSADDTNRNHIQFYRETSGGTTKMAALKDAAMNFVSSIAEDADEKRDHRIAIVQFAGYFSGTNKVVAKLQSAKDNAESLNSKIKGLEANGATEADVGLQMAIDELNGTKDNGQLPADRTRVVVMFTDGEPNRQNGFSDSVADSAVDKAYILKNDMQTTVYTIGIFEGADPEAKEDKYKNVNYYMNAVSSNFQKATDYTPESSLGDGSKTAGYYLAASNASALNNIFSKIASNIMSGSAAVELDETTVITDTISETFELPEGTDASAIKVYTQASTANGVWAERETFADADITVNGKTVTVSNFDFQANYVGEHVASDGTSKEWRGKKLIIEIPFEPTAGYFGGNELATNTTAKIENAESKFSEEFGAPTVDVPLRYEIAAQDQAIYLSNTADLSTIMQYVTNAPSTYACDNGSMDYKPNGTNNADVDIVYTLKDSAENTVATLTIPHGTAASACSWVWAEDVYSTPVLTADTTYTVSCTVTAATQVKGGTNNSLTVDPEIGNVYVYKPQVTANDETVDYGAVVTLKDQVVGEVEWTHPKHATIGNLLDTTKKPSTALTFKVNDAVATTATVTAETPVEITLGLNDPQATFNFMPYTTFVRNATTCDFDTCDAKDETSHIGTAEACEFKLHLGTISGVKVKKVVTGNMANRNQEFEFTATYADQTVNFKLAHDGEYELKNLPIGATLTITETQTGYTTTYSTTAQEAGESVVYTDDAIAADDAGKVITFNNHKEAEIDTGISLDSLPYILLLAVVAAGVVFFVVRRKRSED